MEKGLTKAVRYIAYVILLSAILVMLYWITGNVPEGRNSTKMNTAFCFFLLAIQTIIFQKQRRNKTYFLFPSILVILIGTFSLVENLLLVDFGIDTFLLIGHEEFQLMSSATSFTFILLCINNHLIRNHSAPGNQLFLILISIAGLIIFLDLVSYLFLESLEDQPPFLATMSFLTASLFGLTIIGQLLLRPDLGIVKLLLRNQLGGKIARRMMAAIVSLTILIGFLLLYFDKQSILSLEFRFVSLITLTIVVAIGTTVYLGHWINEIDSDRSKLTEQLKSSLIEKDELLKELHHRIKNNLQLISSLIYIQSTTAKEEEFKNFLLEINGRIQAIYTIHEFLLQRKLTKAMNVNEYLTSLSSQTIASFNKSKKKFSLELNIQDAEMDPDLAFNVGIIFNETISSLLKNPLTHRSEIKVSLTTDEKSIHLSFSDIITQEMLPEFKKLVKSINMKNLETFVDLLRGQLSYEFAENFKINIKLNNPNSVY